MIYNILLNLMIQHVAVEENVYSFAVTFAITFTLWFTSWSHTYIFSVLSNTLWHLLISSIEDLKNPFIRLRVKTWNNVAPFQLNYNSRIPNRNLKELMKSRHKLFNNNKVQKHKMIPASKYNIFLIGANNGMSKKRTSEIDLKL